MIFSSNKKINKKKNRLTAFYTNPLYVIQMTEKELIENLLGLKTNQDFEQESLTSTLLVALKGARYLTNRNLETGESDSLNKENTVLNGVYTSNLFIGLTNYLIILDLIGCLFSNSLEKKRSKDGIEHSLLHFSDLSEKEKKSIKNLRNSLAHNYSLGNESEIFSISSTYTEMIEFGAERFVYGNEKKKSQYTNINDGQLCDFIEEIFKKLKIKLEQGQLQLKGSLNKNQIKARFTIK
jgi:hypothetical protein